MSSFEKKCQYQIQNRSNRVVYIFIYIYWIKYQAEYSMRESKIKYWLPEKCQTMILLLHINNVTLIQ